MKRKKVRNRFFGLTSRVLMLIVAGLLILSYASIVVNPAKVWLISLVGIFFVPLSLINFILLLWALKRRSKSFVIPLLALLPAFIFGGRYLQFDSDEDRIARMPHSDNTVRIVSYNVGRFALDEGEFRSRTECADSVFAYILAQDPDIICLQEFHTDNVDNIRSYLRRRMSDYKAEYYLFPTGKGAFGNITLSKLPVKDKGVIKFDGSTNLAIYTDYQQGGKSFRVYNCHFESYSISMSGILRAMVGRYKAVFAETGYKMKRSITRRPKQVDQVFSHIEDCPVESFVCGDFNDNPMSYTYYRMTRGRKDAFVEAGDGFGATFATMWPVLRIDYVLAPESFKVVSHEIPRIPYSDHYPVITEIEL